MSFSEVAKKFRAIVFALFFVFNIGSLFAQVNFNGSLILSNDFYKVSGIEKRLPDNVAKSIMRFNISLYDQINLPFEFYFSTQETKFQQPFNQFGVSPRISDWLTIHGGYFSIRLSELSFGDIRIMGGGAEITPGNYRLKMFYGKSRSVVNPDSANGISGVYKQLAYGLQLGYGDEATDFVNLNMYHAVDDTNSISEVNNIAKPKENLALTASFGWQASKTFNFKGEAAFSAFTDDIRQQEYKKNNIKAPPFFFSPKVSSQMDVAFKLLTVFNPSQIWSLALATRWIGPGYTTLGYSQNPNDIFENTLSPTLRLLDNKLNLRAVLGVRQNNLRSNRLSTTSRFTGSLLGDYQISQAFGFNLNYNNNQTKSSHKNDSIKITNVFNSISVSPRLSFNWLDAINNANLSYSFQDATDENPIYKSSVQNRTHSIIFAHSIVFESTLSFISSVFYSSIDSYSRNIEMFNINETIGKSFFDNSFSASLSIGFTQIYAQEIDDQILARISLSYSVGKYGVILFDLSNNNYTSGSAAAPSFNELQGSVQYNLNL